MKLAMIGLTWTLGVVLLAGIAHANARDNDQAFWDFRPNYAGNGPIDLGDDADDDGLPETIVWCLDGDGTHSKVLDEDDNQILFTLRNEIYDAAGTLQCTAHEEDGLYKLREGFNGPVVLTATKGCFVFEGDVKRLPVRATKAWRKTVRRQLAYEFYGSEIYDGRRRLSDVEITANERISRANPMRKLLIGALLSGQCGADEDNEPR